VLLQDGRKQSDLLLQALHLELTPSGLLLLVDPVGDAHPITFYAGLLQVFGVYEECTRYLPDPTWSVRPIDRKFAFTIVASIRPEKQSVWLTWQSIEAVNDLRSILRLRMNS